MATVQTFKLFNTNSSFYQEEHDIFRKSLRAFLDKEARPYFNQWEREGIVPRSFWRKMGEHHFLCPWLESDYGGLETDFGFSVVLSEELERIGSGLSGISLHSDIIAPYISAFGTKEQKEKYLSKIAKGELILAIAMTEPGAGSDLANIKTRAIKKGNQYIVNGAKTFITNGYQADLYIVACKTDPNAVPAHKGMSLLLIERNTPGFEISRKLEKLGLRSSDTAELFFNDAIVPEENLLGEEGHGFRFLMEKLQQERLICTLNSQVAAEQMLQETITYIKEREVFGQKVSQFQNTRFKIAEMATEIEIGRTFVNNLISKHIAGEKIVTEVSMAKYWVAEMAKRIAAECLQLHGGYGYMEEYTIARRFRDIPVTSIYGGSNEIMKKIIAKNIGL